VVDPGGAVEGPLPPPHAASNATATSEETRTLTGMP
jgi:hypothetical protein